MPYSLGGVRQKHDTKFYIASLTSGINNNTSRIAILASGENKGNQNVPYSHAGIKQHINITCHLSTVALGKINNISHIAVQASGENNTCRIASEASGETTHAI